MTVLGMHERVTDKNGILIRLYLCIWFTGNDYPDPPTVHLTESSRRIHEAHHARLTSRPDGWRINGTRKAPNYVPLGSRDETVFFLCTRCQRLLPLYATSL